MYASRTPRDLNHDPEPWVTNEPEPMRFGAELKPRRGDRYDPRPEFDHAQHNEPNPILAYILREAVELDAQENPPILDLANTALYILTAGLEVGEYDEAHTPGEINHARRVLTRLANLAEKEQA